MNTNGYEILRTTKFKKNYKLSIKRKNNISLFEKTIEDICGDNPLDEKYKDHVLSGEFKGISELHIQPDWLLMYLKDKKAKVLTLMNIGTHSDLFDSVRKKDSFLEGLVRLHDNLKRK